MTVPPNNGGFVFPSRTDDSDPRYQCVCGWDRTDASDPDLTRKRSIASHISYQNHRGGEEGHMTLAEWHSSRPTKRLCARVERLLGVNRPIPGHDTKTSLGGLRAYVRGKVDDPEERLAILAGFVTATEAWPSLADAPASLWAFVLAVVVIVMTAIVSDSKYLSARIPDRLERELVLERDRQLSRFNLVQKTIQGGFGLALGLVVVVLDDYFHLGLLDGGIIDQLVQLSRLLVGF